MAHERSAVGPPPTGFFTLVVGAAVGAAVGTAVGAAVGAAVGTAVGAVVGAVVGAAGSPPGFFQSFVGAVVGALVGAAVGAAVGTVGSPPGFFQSFVGAVVGAAVEGVGAAVGATVGAAVGAAVDAAHTRSLDAVGAAASYSPLLASQAVTGVQLSASAASEYVPVGQTAQMGLAGSAGRLSPQMQLLGVENPCAQLHTTGHASYAGLGSAAVPSSLQYFVLLL